MKLALITGAYRGLGLEWCKQLGKRNYKVILTARNYEKAEAAAKNLMAHGIDIYPHEMDVTNEKQVKKLSECIDQYLDKVDLLINNAGINSGTRANGNDALKMKNLSLDQLDSKEVLNMVHINSIAPIIVAKYFKKLLARSENGKVIHIGSWLGSISIKKNGGNYSYAVSKSALNMMNRALAYDLLPHGITSVVVNPGWVQTDMGGEKAQFTTEQSVQNLINNVVKRIDIEDTGKFYNWDGNIHPW